MVLVGRMVRITVLVARATSGSFERLFWVQCSSGIAFGCTRPIGQNTKEGKYKEQQVHFENLVMKTVKYVKLAFLSVRIEYGTGSVSMHAECYGVNEIPPTI